MSLPIYYFYLLLVESAKLSLQYRQYTQYCVAQYHRENILCVQYSVVLVVQAVLCTVY